MHYIGRFLADLLEGVPTEVIDFLAGQLGIADPSCVQKYAQREPTHREHAGKIQKALELKDFAQVQAELAVLVWTSLLVGAIPRQGKTFATRPAAAGLILDPHTRLYVADSRTAVSVGCG
jgi:hypothetical protein